MAAQIVIRPGSEADIEELTELLRLLFAIEADFSFDREKQRRGLAMLLQKGSECCLMVAKMDGKIVGMCSAQLLVSTAEGGLKAIVEDMVVAEDCRGRGLGKKLLAAVETWARTRGVKRLDLLADRHNAPALQFYGHMCWSRTDLIALQKKLC